MAAFFCVTVRFLQPLCHARGDGGDPEWPPSPLRLFQALVAAAAARWNERMRLDHAISALRWLEEMPCPEIVAAPGKSPRNSYRLYVPDNVGDLVAASWTRGGNADIAEYRSEKDVRPTNVEGDAVHYLFRISPEDHDFEKHEQTLVDAAHSITHLGWGIDMAVGDASVLTEEKAANLPGERWLPIAGRSAMGLRVATKGTLENLMRKHHDFLHRLSRDARGNESFNPVAPLSAYRVVGYRRAIDPVPRPFQAFSILRLDGEGFRPFDAVRETPCVAGMVRHTVCQTAKDAGWPQAKIKTFVHGHSTNSDRPARSEDGVPRFSYLPLPTIEARGPRGDKQANEVVGSIRRVLIVGPAANIPDEVVWARRALSGQELVNEKTQVAEALLSLLPNNDHRVRRYTGASPSWTTVTPVILPGYEDPGHLRRRLSKSTSAEEQCHLLAKVDARIEALLRKAIRQAGFSEELARNAAIDWRTTGFLPGVDLAARYCVPVYLKRFSRYHVKMTWRDSHGNPIALSGPIAIGGGRFAGFGLFVALNG